MVAVLVGDRRGSVRVRASGAVESRDSEGIRGEQLWEWEIGNPVPLPPTL